MERVYISGPMTGIDDFNRPAFKLAEEELIKMGYEVVNPHKIGEPSSRLCAILIKLGIPLHQAKYVGFIVKEMGAIISCDYILLLPGWARSKGSVLEIAWGVLLDKSFMLMEETETSISINICKSDDDEAEWFDSQFSEDYRDVRLSEDEYQDDED